MKQSERQHRAAYNCFCFWRDRASSTMRLVAEEIIDATATANIELDRALKHSSWITLSAWKGTEISEQGTRKRATRDFQDCLTNEICEAEEHSTFPDFTVARRILVNSLYAAFDTASGPAVKAKDFLRNTGRAAGIVGPEGSYRRKRYQLDDRAIEMLVRLHSVRPLDTILSGEDDRQSVGAWLDDIAERYGMVLTLERERVRNRFEDATPTASSLRALRGHFPSEQAMARNREFLDSRLELLRCVRRYSDASSVIHVG